MALRDRQEKEGAEFCTMKCFIMCTLRQIFGPLSNKMGLAGEEARMCEREIQYIRRFSRKIERKEIILTSRHRILEDNIKIDNKEIEFKDVD